MTAPVATSGISTIRTGSGNDFVTITKAPGADGLRGLYEVTINGKSQLMSEEELRTTHFDLGNGNDVLVATDDVRVGITAIGGKGKDILIGGAGDDSFIAGGDRDVDYLDGRGGSNGLMPDNGDLVVAGRNDLVVDEKSLDDMAAITRNLVP